VLLSLISSGKIYQSQLLRVKERIKTVESIKNKLMNNPRKNKSINKSKVLYKKNSNDQIIFQIKHIALIQYNVSEA